MPDPVPVASNLLDSKFLGFSVRRLLESMAIPVAPCAILHVLRFPLLFTFPLFVVGIGVGVLIFVKTPPGQRPLRYTHAAFRHRAGENVYVWAPSDSLENDLASGACQDDWLTQPPSPDVTTYHPQHAGTATAPTADRERTDPGVGLDAGEEAR